MCDLVLMYCDNQGWILSLSAPRSCSAMCPDRGSRRLVFKVLRSGSRWYCATPCPTPRTPPLHHWCHKGLLSCSTAILTPLTPQKVGGNLSQSFFPAVCVLPPSVNTLVRSVTVSCPAVSLRSGGCCTVSRAHVPSSARGPTLRTSLRSPNHTPQPGPWSTRLEEGGGLHPALSHNQPPREPGAITRGAT